MATLLDGIACSKNIYETLGPRIARLREHDRVPLLAIVLVGNDSRSLSYIERKQKQAAALGITCTLHPLPTTATTTDVVSLIHLLNLDSKVSGIIVQLPLPVAVNQDEVVQAISAEKDVDALNNSVSAKVFLPPTAYGIVTLLHFYNIQLIDEPVAVVGQGVLVGKPVTELLQQERARVTPIDITTPNQKDILLKSKVIISGAGKPGLITGDMVSRGTAVVDAGLATAGGVMRGDVDFDSVSPKASFITPTKGGVGPMTVAMLLFNVVLAAEKALDNPVARA